MKILDVRLQLAVFCPSCVALSDVRNVFLITIFVLSNRTCYTTHSVVRFAEKFYIFLWMVIAFLERLSGLSFSGGVERGELCPV